MQGQNTYWFGEQLFESIFLIFYHNENNIQEINIHSCPASAENVEAKKVVTSLKRRAVGTMETPAILRATTFENIPTPVLARLPNKDATKKVFLIFITIKEINFWDCQTG